MNPDGLGKMSLKDLRDLRESVDKAIADREAQDRAEVQAKLAEVATKAGFRWQDQLGGTRVCE